MINFILGMQLGSILGIIIMCIFIYGKGDE